MLQHVIRKIRKATSGGPLEGKLFLVGGLLRDRALGLAPEQDIDIVCQVDALEVAKALDALQITDHAPVVYPRFGTAMVMVEGVLVEFATARRESYDPGSRKPSVEPATLDEDVLRRDFTVNTLLENLHTGEEFDLTGKARPDLTARIIRTPLDPEETFRDDPLRMLRAVRFAAKLDFTVEAATLQAIETCAGRLDIISAERIRDEFSKTLLLPKATRGLEMLRETGLLGRFAPELGAMHGVSQNVFHIYDVWNHTLKAMDALPGEADLVTRLAMLFHDVGKPPTRSEDETGAHFYAHQSVGAEMTSHILHRLKFPNDVIEQVTRLVGLHMRIGEYKAEWSDSAVRRLVRDFGEQMETLFVISEADKSACNPEQQFLDLSVVRQRVAHVQEEADYTRVESPLDGREIMRIADIPPGPEVGRLKEMLVNEILEGRLVQGDQESAERMLREALEREREH